MLSVFSSENGVLVKLIYKRNQRQHNFNKHVRVVCGWLFVVGTINSIILFKPLVLIQLFTHSWGCVMIFRTQINSSKGPLVHMSGVHETLEVSLEMSVKVY